MKKIWESLVKKSWENPILQYLFIFSCIFILVGLAGFFQRTDSSKHYYLITFFVGFLLLVGGVFWVFRKQFFLINAPTFQSTVKVFSKSTDAHFYYKEDEAHRYKCTNIYYFASFAFPDGSRKKFEVDMYQYKSIVEDNTGTLTYKEKGEQRLFIGFEKDS